MAVSVRALCKQLSTMMLPHTSFCIAFVIDNNGHVGCLSVTKLHCYLSPDQTAGHDTDLW